MFQEFDVQRIEITIGDSKRSGAILISASSSSSSSYSSSSSSSGSSIATSFWLEGEFRPLAYRVAVEDDCGRVFGVPVSYSPTSLQAVMCGAFSNAPASRNEKVTRASVRYGEMLAYAMVKC